MQFSAVRFGQVTQFNPPTKENPIATGVMTYRVTQTEEGKPPFRMEPVPFQAYYPARGGALHIMLPEGNYLSAGDHGVGAKWNFTWSASDAVFEDAREILRRFAAVLSGTPRVAENPPPPVMPKAEATE